MIARGDAKRWWTFRGQATSAMLAGSRLVKARDAFTDHTTDDELRDVLDECAAWDVPRPTGYGSVFHARFRMPRDFDTRALVSHNLALMRGFHGGWSEAIRKGELTGPHYLYDMRSAYLWAGLQGLPDPRTFRMAARVTAWRRACFLLELREPAPWAPFPYNMLRTVLATPDEIDAYALPVGRVLSGVTWDRECSGQRIADALAHTTFWKQAGRLYWGRWASREGVRCYTIGGKDWQLPARDTNVLWAHMIVGRVRMRLWEAASETNAAHVYVDSILTPARMRHGLGDGLGEWKLERDYPDGVRVLSAGAYGPLHGPLDRNAGNRHDVAQIVAHSAHVM